MFPFVLIVNQHFGSRYIFNSVHFDSTIQSDTTQLTQSQQNCVDTWACRTASATSRFNFAYHMHTNSALA